MPISGFTDVMIKSEEDIPEDILRIIKNEKDRGEIEYSSNFIAGQRGEIISDLSEIRELLSDSDFYYAGHGTPGSETVVDSIFHNGLYVNDPDEAKGYMATLRGLDSTTVGFGLGSADLFDRNKEDLNHWPHKDSKNVIIVEIPKDYIITMTATALGDKFESFYVKNSNPDAYQGLILRPEFIRGVYNADTHSFTVNTNFYKNLSLDQQRQIMEDVKAQYIQSYADNVLVCPSSGEFDLPLNDEEMKRADLEWYREQYSRLKDYQNIVVPSEEVDDEWGDYDMRDGDWSKWDSFFEEEEADNKGASSDSKAK